LEELELSSSTPIEAKSASRADRSFGELVLVLVVVLLFTGRPLMKTCTVEVLVVVDDGAPDEDVEVDVDVLFAVDVDVPVAVDVDVLVAVEVDVLVVVAGVDGVVVVDVDDVDVVVSVGDDVEVLVPVVVTGVLDVDVVDVDVVEVELAFGIRAAAAGRLSSPIVMPVVGS
jgi:hypothetical protein